MSSVEPMTHICSKQLVTLSPRSIFFSYFHLRHKTEIQVCYTLDSREISREKSVERLYPKSAVLRTDDVIGCRNVTTYKYGV